MRDVEELKRISDEEQRLQQQLLALNQRMIDLITRKHSVRTRAGETFKRGTLIDEGVLSSLTPVSGSQGAQPDPQSTGEASGTTDFPLLSDVDWSSLDPALLADPGFADGTAGAFPGSSNSRGVPTS